MGGAAALGLHKCGAGEITVTARHAQTLEKFKAEGIETSLDNAQAVKGADIVCLVVKPWLMEEVTKDLAPSLEPSQLIVSMAPGVKSSDLLGWLPEGARLSYVIPNTAIEFGKSATFIAPVTCTAQDTACLRDLFDRAGSSIVVEESQLIAGTSLTSCGIAYALKYIDAAMQGGESLGFAQDQSLEAVISTMEGAVEILRKRGNKPQTEIDKVTTPGGMTLKGLEAMEKAGFSQAVQDGLLANK